MVECEAMKPSGSRIVDQRIVRRVIKHQLKISGFGLRIPHDHCVAVRAEVLRKLASPQELGMEELPTSVVLLAREEILSSRDQWRHEFHGKIHLALEEKRHTGVLSDVVVRARIHAIGQIEFDEIRRVLGQEDLILARQQDAAVYVEFAATYLEYRYFEPGSISQLFPTICEYKHILQTLLLDLDPEGLLESSRPPEESAITLQPLEKGLGEDCQIESHSPSFSAPGGVERLQLAARASLAESQGNLVRAAICNARLSLGSKNNIKYLQLIEALAQRIVAALGQGEGTLARWVGVLTPLVETAASSGRMALGVEARLLLDLQKACVAHEEVRRTIDVVGWASSLGRRAVVRELPVACRVNVVRHLRAAQQRAGGVRVESEKRRCLVAELVEAQHLADKRLREDLGPRIRRVLESVGLKPSNVPERVALRKLVDELLDQAAQRGFFTFSFLRDCISRSQLKLPNLSGPGEWWRGDVLLQADVQLEIELDGVYRGGEVYMRALQRGSSLFFGTPIGQVLTLHLLLPVLAAFVLLEGLQHLVGPLSRWIFHIHHLRLVKPWSLLIFALFLYGMIHSERFRFHVWNAALVSGRAVRSVFIDFPRWLVHLDWIQMFLQSAPVRALWGFLLKPMLVVSPLYILLPDRFSPRQELQICGPVFVLLTLVLNTSIGVAFQEHLAAGMTKGWRYLNRQIFPGILAFFSELSHRMVEGFDQLLYAVDERLRFHQGDSRLIFWIKGGIGTLWFFVTYFLRIGINVLFEPQVNPIKHFPVVTVSHKIFLPMTPSLASVFEQVGLSRAEAMSAAVPIITLLPGVVGFLVWELKGNWYLYASNRSAKLRPVLVGHHGEAIGALLKIGFHSGTIPKLFAKMRRAIRQGSEKAGKYREQLRDVEHAVERFVHRELIVLLEESKTWSESVSISKIELGSNRIRIHLHCQSVSAVPAVIHLEEQSGWLVASVAQQGWIDRLGPQQRELLEAALAGFYRLAGVELCREQIEAQLAEGVLYDIAQEGLVVWPRGGDQQEVIYPLLDKPKLSQKIGKSRTNSVPELDGDRLLLMRQPISWATWLTSWKSPMVISNSLTSLRRAPLLLGPRGQEGGILGWISRISSSVGPATEPIKSPISALVPDKRPNAISHFRSISAPAVTVPMI